MMHILIDFKNAELLKETLQNELIVVNRIKHSLDALEQAYGIIQIAGDEYSEEMKTLKMLASATENESEQIRSRIDLIDYIVSIMSHANLSFEEKINNVNSLFNSRFNNNSDKIL